MRAIGIILAGGNSNRLKELSAKRAVGAMPIAGSYRAIDFGGILVESREAYMYLLRQLHLTMVSGIEEQQMQLHRI